MSNPEMKPVADQFEDYGETMDVGGEWMRAGQATKQQLLTALFLERRVNRSRSEIDERWHETLRALFQRVPA